jgi:hypothetical protein
MRHRRNHSRALLARQRAATARSVAFYTTAPGARVRASAHRKRRSARAFDDFVASRA